MSNCSSIFFYRVYIKDNRGGTNYVIKNKEKFNLCCRAGI
ncbi:hypothetical protein PRABACTJOHN_00660 [Parabacteroides johnsonii DSM 18315]|uniref:Uncharacterized protein n=1 Tax=Parabacteroides johnsonii DSM 18315 TaxID=537006 RepID=B7B6L5_9BACT|nr:hypothetical protein PRABACTJOHN_00660 [Parabacteroides johnsonii DSM 18315]